MLTRGAISDVKVGIMIQLSVFSETQAAII